MYPKSASLKNISLEFRELSELSSHFVTFVEKEFQRKNFQLFATKHQIFHLNSRIFPLNSRFRKINLPKFAEKRLKTPCLGGRASLNSHSVITTSVAALG